MLEFAKLHAMHVIHAIGLTSFTSAPACFACHHRLHAKVLVCFIYQWANVLYMLACKHTNMLSVPTSSLQD